MASLFPLCLALLIAASVSSFTVVEAEDTSKEEIASKEDSSSDSKENKRSQEEVLFGNQQNRPNGLVDDLMDNAGEEEEDEAPSPQDKKEGVDASSDSKSDESSVSPQPDESGPGESGSSNWYSPVPDSTKAMQYLASHASIKLPSDDFPASLYDREDLYRRKRQLPLPLYRRKRQLRSSLGQMIQKRGIRLPRRSMRLKRQVDMGDLLGLIESQRAYEEQPQLTPHIFGGRSQTVAKRRVPSVYSSYPDALPKFRIPYVFQSPDLPAGDPEEAEEEDLDGMDDVNELMLLPPNSRMPLDEKEAFQKWLALHTVPSPRLQRRSPSFYPLDYRYVVPEGYRKRSVFSHGHRRGGNLPPSDPEGGKWGHVVQVPEAYASPEDIARLYGLAGLMAQSEEEEGERRRRQA